MPLVHGACDDWRARVKLAFDDPASWRFAGAYPASCGPRSWPLAYAEPASYDARLVEALWREAGGSLKGRVRDGTLPAGVEPAFEVASPPLAEVVRDINKYSNNVMAEQVFLSLAAPAGATPPADAASAATPEAARADRRAEERPGRARGAPQQCEQAFQFSADAFDGAMQDNPEGIASGQAGRRAKE